MDQNNNKTQPNNIEAEMSLLGAILIDADSLVKIADSVNEDDFYDPKHKRIFSAIINLYNDHDDI